MACARAASYVAAGPAAMCAILVRKSDKSRTVGGGSDPAPAPLGDHQAVLLADTLIESRRPFRWAARTRNRRFFTPRQFSYPGEFTSDDGEEEETVCCRRLLKPRPEFVNRRPRLRSCSHGPSKRQACSVARSPPGWQTGEMVAFPQQNTAWSTSTVGRLYALHSWERAPA